MIGDDLSQGLSGQRDALNQRFRTAALRHQGLDPAGFATHLTVRVDPIVGAAAGAMPDRASMVTRVLFDASLEIVGRRLFDQYPALDRAWTELLPRLGGAVAATPLGTVGAVTNAIVGQECDPDRWIDVVLRLAPKIRSAAHLREAGVLASWQAGAAHLRHQARQRWDRLDDDTARLAVGAEPDTDRSELAARLDDPWHDPRVAGRARTTIVRRIGGFVGFGGPFHTPPQVQASDGQLFVADENRWWRLHLDLFGTSLRPVSGRPEGNAANSSRWAVTRGRARGPVGEVELPRLARNGTWASDQHSLVVASRRSHELTVVAGGTQ
ncbi:MAG: hypothetical protein GY929_18370 [Actinomycetia bacterium]|nr:hypothetical protein [Actinomycetes bacterium]